MALTPANRPARARWRPRVAALALWALTMLGLVATAWLDRLLRQAGLAELTILAAASLPWVMALVSAATVGAVLASRRPEHPVGWLLLALGLSGQLNNLANQYVHYGVMGRPGAWPAASYLSGSNSSGAVLVLTCAGFIALLTPTGSLPSPRWRWWARVVVAATVVLLLARALDPHPLVPEDPTFQNPLVAPPALAGPLVVAGAVSMAIVLAGLVIAAGSLVLRLRRARGMERQQLRWLALAAAVAAVALLVAVAAGAKGNEGMVLAAIGTSVASLPLATGAAILRYRLYDLDRIISRTVAYGLLTVLLGLGYAGVVLGLGQLFGQDSSLAVAGATLAVAAAFQPARRRIQRLVDRRFNRRRYDAARTIAAFSARLREEVDLDTLSAELVAVVERTMQPTHVWLWLRPQPPSAPAGVAGAQQRR